MKKIILTGIGGFIGSHCLEYFLNKTDWLIYGIDSFEHKGTYSRLNEVIDRNQHKDRIRIFHHDLTAPVDAQLENQLMDRAIGGVKIPVDCVFNLASDSAVERSITNPGNCWKNNCNLIYNVLEFVRKIKPRVFLHVSTDEVFGEAINGAHKEWDTILPSNVYSASKAAQEAICISYWRTYDVPLVLCNMMNAIGEWQDKEKFLPKLIWKVATDQEMEVYGEPGNIGSRFYIHCKNIADAMIFLSKREMAMYTNGSHYPDRYNVVGDIELDNLQLAQYVARVMGKELKYKFISSETARRGYDKRYALDGAKLASLGWKHPIPTLTAVDQIVEWTLKNPHWLL